MRADKAIRVYCTTLASSYVNLTRQYTVCSLGYTNKSEENGTYKEKERKKKQKQLVCISQLARILETKKQQQPTPLQINDKNSLKLDSTPVISFTSFLHFILFHRFLFHYVFLCSLTLMPPSISSVVTRL